ncbi:MAG: penicillin-binding transpeptidase domain-containing protein [Oscillospiraceae bacterium]
METKDFSLANPYTFANDIESTTATVIMENSMKLKGAYVSENTKRSYPNGDTAPHIIGQVGPIYENERDIYTKEKGYNLNDIVGKSGIEKTMESVLRGKDGKKQIVLDSKGAVTEILENEAAQPGNTVVLTIDAKMQQIATQALEKKIKQLNANAREKRGKEADSGAVVVIDVKTGEVLTSANYPTYDLANYNKDFAALNEDKRRPLWDRALLGQYSPGSVFKPVVGVAAMGEGLMEAEDTVFCGHTYTFFQDYQPTCVGNHGAIEITRALQESCNIYFFDVGRRLGVDTINKYAKELGLGVETGIELPENVGRLSTPELFSSLRKNEVWTGGNTLQASIGQLDTRFTPMQIANYTSTLANKGKRMDVNIIKSV